jgi:glycosyltransferase involved in cell wall biosynthesis
MNALSRPPGGLLRAGFVMEQALGHVTHYRNLRQYADQQSDIQPTWLPVPFEASGATRLVPLVRSNWSVRASWRARRALDAIDARRTLDALFFHSQVTSLFSVSLMRSVPSVISLDATPINYDSVGAYYGHSAAGGGFVDRRKFEMNQRAFATAAGIVTWSEWARSSLVHDYGVDGSKVQVIPPGASPSFFEIGKRRGENAAPRSGRLRVLFVGGDFQRKGGPLLLELMRGQLGEVCELHLVTQSSVAAQPNVFVHNGVEPNSERLLGLFRDADVFVLPTHADCLAVVLEEAAAAGLPVLTTDVGAQREAVDEDHSGFIVPAGDARALSTALLELAGNPNRRVQMGRAAYAFACRRFDAHLNNRALLNHLHAAAAAAAPRSESGRAA